MVETSNLNKNLYFFDMMYLFLIIMEIITVIYSYSMGIGGIGKFILPIIYIALGINYKYNKANGINELRKYTYVTAGILLIYLIFNIIFSSQIFTPELFIIEVCILLVFSSINLKEKRIINFLFDAVLVIGFLFLIFSQ